MRFDDKHNGNIYYVCSKASLAGNCKYQSIRYQELESKILAKMPDMFGFVETENEPDEDPKIIDLRSKLSRARQEMERLVQMGAAQDGELQVINDIITVKRREENSIHADLNRLIGMQTRNKQEKEGRKELKQNIREILEGEFKGILSHQDETQRIRLKKHLAKVIKRIKIVFLYLSTGQLATWTAEIELFGGRIIAINRDAETEILVSRSDLDSKNDIEETIEEYWNNPDTKEAIGLLNKTTLTSN